MTQQALFSEPEQATLLSYGRVAFIPADGRRRAMWGIAAKPHVMIRVKRLFPRARPDAEGTLVLQHSNEVARDLAWLMERHPLAIDEFSRAQLDRGVREHRDAEDNVAAILAGTKTFAGERSPAQQSRPYQVQAADVVTVMRRTLITDALGLGKAQPLDSLVLTPSGYVPMGDLEPGSMVIAADGTPTRVAGVFPQGELDEYEVEFTDGAVVRCNDEHLWTVRHARGATRSKTTGERNPVYWRTATLRELMDRGITQSGGQAKWHVPMLAAPELATPMTRPVDPYLIGVLLGDGGLTQRCVRFSTADEEMVAFVEAALPPGMVVKKHTGYDYRILHETRQHTARGHGRNDLVAALDSLNMMGKGALDKRVPKTYLLAPVAARLAVLQGLMDTDGYAMPLSSGTATAQFYSSSEGLALDVRVLAESLGGTGRVTSKHFKGRDRYAVTVNLPAPFNPFRLARKASVWGDGHATLKPTRAIREVRATGRKVPMQCIGIEHPSRLYVTDRFVVTHNTHSGALTFRNADSLPGVVVPQTHLTRQWERELNVIWPDLTVYVPKKSTPDAHFEKWCAKNGGPPDLYVVPYSKLDGWQHHLQDVVKSIVFDEVQELRGGIGTNKGAAAANLASRSNFVAGLTATPIYNYGDEIHAIYSIVSPDSLGSREEFLREWGGRQWTQQGGKQKATIKNPKALSMFLRDNGLMIGRTRRDVGRELPFGDVEKVPHTIDADPAVLEKLSGDAVELARLILAKTSDREQRFRASGELDSMLRQATGLAKAPFVASFVSSLIKGEQTEKVILWGWHHAVYDVWTERLKRQGIRVARYTGTESTAGKEQAIARFMAPAEHPHAADVLIMSVRSGAGLDGLQKVCSVGVFGELDWSSKVMDQCAGRLARDGQENAVVTYYLMADSGADPEMVQALDLKHAQAAPFEDPNAEVLSALPDPTNRIRSLAEDVLRQAGAR